MSWSALANNQWVSCNDLQDAVNTGHFTLKPAQTIPATNQFVTRTNVETWTNAIVTSGSANQWPQKSWLVTTTTTSSATTTTTTTVAGPYVTLIFHNESPNSPVSAVHGTGYNPNYTYPINNGQTQTDTFFPLSAMDTIGCWVTNNNSTSEQYYMVAYRNSVLLDDGSTNLTPSIAVGVEAHATTDANLASGTSAGDVFDVYLRML